MPKIIRLIANAGNQNFNLYTKLLVTFNKFQDKTKAAKLAINKHRDIKYIFSNKVFHETVLLLDNIISKSTNSLGTIATPKSTKGINTDKLAALLADSAAVACAIGLLGLSFFSVRKAK